MTPNLNESPRCGINEAARVVAHPVASGHSAGTPAPYGARLANLDCHDRLVKKGRVVSWGGLRFRVSKVRAGRFWGVRLDAFGKDTSGTIYTRCERVQVVA